MINFFGILNNDYLQQRHRIRLHYKLGGMLENGEAAAACMDADALVSSVNDTQVACMHSYKIAQ